MLLEELEVLVEEGFPGELAEGDDRLPLTQVAAESGRQLKPSACSS